MEGEDLGLPRLDGPGKPGEFRDLDAIAPPVEALQRGPGVGQVTSVDRAQQLLALPGGRHLTGRISSRKAGP
jgi:hypothetical protein